MVKKEKRNNRKVSVNELLIFIALVILANFIASLYYTRFDLTKEKKYSISQPTKKMLRNLDDKVYVKVYLEGKNLPAGFKRLQSSTKDLLNEFSAYSNGRLDFVFIDPFEGQNDEQKVETIKAFAKEGMDATNLQVKTDDASQQQIIIPAAMVSYHGGSMPIQLLENQSGFSPEEVLNHSVIALEYKFANAIQKLSLGVLPKVLFIEGYGEADDKRIADLAAELQKMSYNVKKFDIHSSYKIPDDVACAFVIGCKDEWEEKDKYKLDQYIMKGGRMIFMLDGAIADMDSLRNQSQSFFSVPSDYNLDDLLFSYGVRLNNDLVQDIELNTPIPLMIGTNSGMPQNQLFPWPFYPLLVSSNAHAIVKNLDPVEAFFASTIDTVAKTPSQKTVLLQSGTYSRALLTPVRVSLSIINSPPETEKYNQPGLTMAILLEGQFNSVFKNRPIVDVFDKASDSLPQLKFIPQTDSGKIIVIGDADIAKNDVQSNGGIYPLGYNKYTQQVFANKEFLINAVEYLTDRNGLIESRNKEIKLRLLDRVKIKEEKSKWQMINIAIPLGMVILFGLVFNFLRKRKYGKK